MPSKHKLTFGSWPALAVVLVASLLASLGAGLEWGIYDRQLVASGEWWRIWTAQFAHLNTPHLLLNLSAWALIWAYGWFSCDNARWFWLLACTTAICGWNIHHFETEIMWHGGLSGILHGLFLAITLLKLEYELGDPVAWLGLAALVAKLAWEHFVGPLDGTEDLINLPVLTEAHLHGAFSGVIAWGLMSATRRLRRKSI